MSHRPVCKACEIEYRCSENGVNVVGYGDSGPLVIHEADEFECPSCHNVVIVGFGGGLYSRKGDTDFELAIEWATETAIIRNNYNDDRTKALHTTQKVK